MQCTYVSKMEKPATKSTHVAVIAYPFTSHPISLHCLVVRLARASPETLFTFLNTPSSNASLFRSADLPLNLKPYSLDDGIPVGRDALKMSYPEMLMHFQQALLQPGSLRGALDGAAEAASAEFTSMLVCVGTLAMLKEDVTEITGRQVPWVAVWTAAPQFLSCFIHADLIRRRISSKDFDDTNGLALDFVPGLAGMGISDAPPKEIFVRKLEEEPQLLQGLSRLGQSLLPASAMVLSTFHELNPDELNTELESRFRILLNVGFYTMPIPPPPRGSDSTGCLTWLDGRRPRSVAYICFGTMVDLPEDELRATAEALCETGVPFLWCLRDSQRELLPSDFIETTRSHGRLVSWTNQVQVLGHGSVGVHVTHCGYNSVCESVVSGVPIIGRPFWGDNPMNARTVASVWRIGVTVKALTKDELVEGFEMIMEREEGEKMRERALALKKQVFDASSPTGSGTRDFHALLGLLSAE